MMMIMMVVAVVVDVNELFNVRPREERGLFPLVFYMWSIIILIRLFCFVLFRFFTMEFFKV